MSSKSQTDYNSILEFCEKRLNEGDYLKMANFLKRLHDESAPEIYKIKNEHKDLNIHIEFSTLQNKKIIIEVKSIKSSLTLYKGGHPERRKTYLTGVFDTVKFEDMPYEEFCFKVIVSIRAHGMKNIERKIESRITKFKSFCAYKKYLNKLYKNLDYDDQENDMDYCDAYTVSTLFMIHPEQLNLFRLDG